METLWNVNDVFSMTFYTYDKIREVGWKSWDSAVSLYIRYIEQARLQWTDSTYSNDNFMMKAMWWSKEKFYKVKPILQDLWLIEPKEKRDENWKIINHYVQVNFIIKDGTTTVLENQSLVEPESGKSNTNTICTKYKCLYTKNKYLSENSDGWESTTSSKKKKRTTNEHLLEWETKEKFEKFWNTYPHVTGRSSRKESIPLFLEHNPDDLVVGASILKWEVESWKQQDEFVKASERWLKNFTPITDSHKKRKIKEIMKRHMNTGWDKKTRFEEMQKDFEWVDLKAIAAEIRDEKTQELIESFKN